MLTRRTQQINTAVRFIHVLKKVAKVKQKNKMPNQIFFSHHLLCLQVMRYPERVNRNHILKKKSVKICFSKPEDNEKTEVEGDNVEKPVQTVSELVNEKTFGSLQTQRFEDVVCQLAKLCLVNVNEKNSERHLVFLSLLLRSFHTQRVFSVSYFSLLCISVSVVFNHCESNVSSSVH